jgi:hypothetical protein
MSKTDKAIESVIENGGVLGLEHRPLIFACRLLEADLGRALVTMTHAAADLARLLNHDDITQELDAEIYAVIQQLKKELSHGN